MINLRHLTKPLFVSVAISLIACAFVLSDFVTSALAESESDKSVYSPDWPSLDKYRCPDWYRDAKFGIFMHWSINSVVPGANDGWYGRQMYMQSGAPWGNAYTYQIRTYGHPSQFGYKDLIPLWKAENFRPDELVALFRQAGARYVVPVAVHHDNFDNYASTYQPWNSVNMGPKRDLIEAWRVAILKAGLHFGVSSHSDRSWSWFEPSHGSDSEGLRKGIPYDGNLTKADGHGLWWDGYDPADLYSPALNLRSGASGKQLEDAYNHKWYLRTKELIDKYQPDLLYFDGGMPMGDLGLKLTAELYNERRKGGSTDAVLNIKWNPDRAAAVEDMEKGLSNWIRPHPWQVDCSINNMWFNDCLPLELSSAQIIHTLVDAVSKNGNLLLNVALRADGTLDEEQRRRLQEVGRWLDTNGEAIYGTRPTHLFGEGPTKIKNWTVVDHTLPPFTPQDIRFTAKGDVLYAILMGCPKDTAVVTSLGKSSGIFAGTISSVEILGSHEKINWSQDDAGLHVTIPNTNFSELGVALKISGLKGLSRDEVVRPQADASILLDCWDAGITGTKLAPMDFEPALTNWSDPNEYASWEFLSPKAGTYDVVVRYASGDSDQKIQVSVAGTNLLWKVAKTASGNDFHDLTLGTITLPQSGRYTLTVHPMAEGWHPLSLSYVLIKDPIIHATANGALELPADAATLHGSACFLENKTGELNIGGWKSSQEWVSWDQVFIPKVGRYKVFIDATAGDGDSCFTIASTSNSLAVKMVQTPDWTHFQRTEMGEMNFDHTGVQSISITPQTASTWRAVNVFKLVLKPID